jgi:hypothetical protein
VVEGIGGRERAAATRRIHPWLHAPPCETPAVVLHHQESEGGREAAEEVGTRPTGSGGAREGEGGGSRREGERVKVPRQGAG